MSDHQSHYWVLVEATHTFSELGDAVQLVLSLGVLFWNNPSVNNKDRMLCICVHHESEMLN